MKDLLAKKGVKHLMSFIGDHLPQLAFVMLVLFKEFSFLVLIRFVYYVRMFCHSCSVYLIK